ncbi:MAG: glycosyltransferase family 39 protein [Pyrinomonadaceae bacterium]|nr:glycosyltransferase family 39 protein [Pyrinomonadaceae bacterium]
MFLRRNVHTAIFVLAVALFIAFRLWHLTYYSLDFDEIFSVQAARQTWAALLSVIADDLVHPPLFYLLLKVWIVIGGESLFWLRLFPALTAIASIIPFLLLCRELKFQMPERNLALLLIAVNAYLVFYAQQVRMYSLLFFLTLCSLWLFVKFYKREANLKTNLLALFIVNLLLVYTQYFGWLVIGVEGVFLLLWGRWRSRRLLLFSLSVGALIVCFAPWAYVVAEAAVAKRGLGQNIGWITRPDLSDLVWYYGTLNGLLNFPRATSLSMLIFGFPVLLWGWHSLRREDGRQTSLLGGLLLFSFLPALLTFAASHVLSQSVWVDRYLIIVAAPYLMLVAVAAWRLQPLWLRTIMLALIISWALVAGFYELPKTDKKIAWQALAQQMMRAEPAQSSGVRVYAFEGFVAAPLEFYLETAGERRFQILAVKDIHAATGEHFWIAFRNSTWNQPQQPQEILAAEGYRIGDALTAETQGQTIILFPVWRP